MKVLYPHIVGTSCTILPRSKEEHRKEKRRIVLELVTTQHMLRTIQFETRHVLAEKIPLLLEYTRVQRDRVNFLSCVAKHLHHHISFHWKLSWEKGTSKLYSSVTSFLSVLRITACS